MKKLLLTFLVAGFSCVACFAQSQEQAYDHHAAFAPNFFTDGGNLFRSADGTPGPQYWQNRADYNIEARLDTSSLNISGTVTIDYTNNSPHSLDQLWLQLVQNNTRSDSRASSLYGVQQTESGENGFKLNQVNIKSDGGWQPADYVVHGTRMQVRLEDVLPGKGEHIQIKIDYAYRLPKRGRSGYLDTENGRIYEVSYWYPRMCVYDDLRGWNTLPFLGSGEFYLDYGDIDYAVTLPEGLLVAGSGELQNPEETLTKDEQNRFKQAQKSDQTVAIHPENELGQPATQKGQDGMLTWHFRMENTRDVAWAASKAFIWDAARANLPDGKTTLAMSYYPQESAGPDAWGRATEFLKFSLEHFSEKWFTYPYPAAINVGGPVGGMEYPGITFDSYKGKDYTLFLLVAHEIGHNWFPMIVGSNERRNAWMDEGFNTFIDIYAHDAFNGGEFAPKRDGEYASGGGNPSDEIIPIMNKEGAQPIMSKADAMRGEDVHPVEYFKTAHGLVLLREVVLGPEQFDYAFRKYTHAWAYKHPGANDFFRAMNNYSGENLNWFWKGWFKENWKLDQAISEVKYENDQPEIIIKNKAQLPMPVLLSVTTSDGQTQEYKVPVEVWMRGDTYTFRPQTDQKITKVELDAKHQLPDVNRDNNSWTADQ